ncbi:Helix-loop-helix DNA-binding domain protein [Metarhizium album ARSEF 1941]|uniref:Helix-loop-helix DNA-binding domain protein n=1 Tax=Metarhizium album (strain ARSEF 1941) TaxID=1081103 RepID=A0A0B2WYT8_METAS|nr:Helix-loop-helix DNA-binding domain protein [Metarhizium album ARSEF 1941]KHO01447.1 Helix-loop-helix DNA-binding domain protein [Metarhizium album ARSEF 1941]
MHDASLIWLGDACEWSNLSAKNPYQPHEAYAWTPISGYNLLNDFKNGPCANMHEASPEFGQETNELTDVPNPCLPADAPFQLTSRYESSPFPKHDDAAHSETALPLKPRQEETCGPSDDPMHCSDGQQAGSMSTAADPAERSLTRVRRHIRHRKRKARDTKSEDDEEASNNGLAADETNRSELLRCYHNQVERNYRSRLNNEFQLLLNTLVDCTDERDLVSAGFTGAGTRNQSKGATLRLARRKLLALHTENRLLNNQLMAMRCAWAK